MIYNKLIESVENGGVYRINIRKKNLWINHKQIIKEGVVLVEEDLIECSEEPWKELSDIYKIYKRSVPSKGSKQGLFKALELEDLSLEEMVLNPNRYLATAMLEGYILLSYLSGQLVWQNEEHWFWQDPNDKEFVVLRNVLETK